MHLFFPSSPAHSIQKPYKLKGTIPLDNLNSEMFTDVFDNATWSTIHGTVPPSEMEPLRDVKGPLVCVPRNGGSSRGIFYNGNPLQKSFNLFLVQVILLIFAYRIVYFLLRPLKQTKFVCSVVAGILIGPHMLGSLPIFGEMGLFPPKEIVITGTMGSLGIAYFIFLAAVKMDVSMLWRTAEKATVIGILSVLVPLAALLVTSSIQKLPWNDRGLFPFLLASGLSVTRFANVADSFDELDILTSQQSQLVLSSSMLSEVFTWISLVIGIFYRQHNGSRMIPVWLLLAVIIVLTVAAALRALAKKIIAKLGEDGVVHVNDILVTSIMVVALLMAFMTDLIGSLHMGILIMGLIMPDGPPLGSAITERAEYMVKEFLMPVFYVLVGYSTNIFSISIHLENFWEITIFVIVGFVMKFLAAACGAVACRYDLRNAVLLGLMVNVKGPIDLYLFMRWRFQQDVRKSTHAILVLSHVILTAAVTPLIQKLYEDCQKLNASKRKSIRAIQTSSNYEDFKVLCCVHSMDNIPGIISLLEASNGLGSSKVSATVVHLNDLVGRAAPIVVCNDKQERRVETNKSDAVAHEFESYSWRSNSPIELSNFIVVAPYRTMHENVWDIAQEEMATLIILPYRKVQGDAGASEAVVAQSTAVRNFNCRMLRSNPCAVGILVNKGLGRCMGYDTFSSDIHVAVIFTGGHDDREALAYGARMMMHPAVCVTVLRFIVRCPREYVEDMLEKKLDDALVEEFRIQGMGDSRAMYYEEAAVDPLGTLNAIRALGDHYHLVVTGRESSLIMSIFEESLDTLRSWGENPELGIIGDFIASEDYNKGKSSALIMHRYPSKMAELSKRRNLDYEEECLLGRSV